MPQPKKPKNTTKNWKVRLVVVSTDDLSSEDGSEEKFDENGMVLEKEDMRIIYNAFREYKPIAPRGFGLLVKHFTEILVLGYDGAYFLEKKDVKIIYNALREYKPTEEEERRYGLLIEQFAELGVDYDEPYPGAN